MNFRSRSMLSLIAATTLSCLCSLPAIADGGGKLYPFNRRHRSYSQSGWVAGFARTPEDARLNATPLLIVSPDGTETTSNAVSCPEGSLLSALYVFGVADDGLTTIGFDCTTDEKADLSHLVQIDPLSGTSTEIFARKFSGYEYYAASVAPDGGVSIAYWGVTTGGSVTIDAFELRRGGSSLTAIAHFETGLPTDNYAMNLEVERDARGDSLISYGPLQLLTSHLIEAVSGEVKNVTRKGWMISLKRSGTLVYRSRKNEKNVDVVHPGSGIEQHLTFRGQYGIYTFIEASNSAVSNLVQRGNRIRADIYDLEAGTALRLTCKIQRRVHYEIIEIGLMADGSVVSDQSRLGRRRNISSFAKDPLGGDGSLRCTASELPVSAVVQTRK